ncbi:MAG: rhodanese-like domain-containing protein [Pseudomonadota bacterium]
MTQFIEFAGNNAVLVTLLMISFLVLIFSELRRKAAGMVAIDPVAAVQLINNNGVVIDLRGAEAYSRGHIANAKNIPYEQFDADHSRLASLKNTPLIAVDDAGMNATRAVATLRTSGFESAYTLKGGMHAWAQAGLPVVSGKKTKGKQKK